MIERCLASKGTPPRPIAGAAGVPPPWGVTTGAGFAGGAPAGTLAPRADGATAPATGRTGASAPAIAAGGRGVLSAAAASPVLGSGAGRGNGTVSAFAAPVKPISATPIQSARPALRM